MGDYWAQKNGAEGAECEGRLESEGQIFDTTCSVAMVAEGNHLGTKRGLLSSTCSCLREGKEREGDSPGRSRR